MCNEEICDVCLCWVYCTSLAKHYPYSLPTKQKPIPSSQSPTIQADECAFQSLVLGFVSVTKHCTCCYFVSLKDKHGSYIEHYRVWFRLNAIVLGLGLECCNVQNIISFEISQEIIMALIWSARTLIVIIKIVFIIEVTF